MNPRLESILAPARAIVKRQEPEKKVGKSMRTYYMLQGAGVVYAEAHKARVKDEKCILGTVRARNVREARRIWAEK